MKPSGAKMTEGQVGRGQEGGRDQVEDRHLFSYELAYETFSSGRHLNVRMLETPT